LPIIVLLVSPFGFGKSTVLKYINYIMTQISSDDNNNKYNFKGKYLLAHSLFDDTDETVENEDGEGEKDNVFLTYQELHLCYTMHKHNLDLSL
jgi:energy-coupling factor transporter ATP-binding protein EcfA2